MIWLAVLFFIAAAFQAWTVIALTAINPTGKTVGSFVPAGICLAVSLLLFSVWLAGVA